MRPTGKMHLGHLEGVLQSYVAMQDKYRVYYMIADWHALTTDYEKPGQIAENTAEMIKDWLSVGIDPAKAALFVQSSVKEHAELALLLGFITPVPWLERNPTYKEQRQELTTRDLSTYGFLGYPVLMAADILLYKSDVVPIGEDQRPHLELAREIARRFNNLYGEILFPEPKEILTRYPKLPGIDGRKMSKSYDNAIFLTDDEKTVGQKIQRMFTDPKKIRKNDPGNPDNCVVCAFHQVYNTAECDTVISECRSGTRGCVDCKKALAVRLNARLAPIREKRATIDKDPSIVADIIRDGTKRARQAAGDTMSSVRRLMKLG
ncbi:MAG: tryptophan--tRNA ligase [Spirochaetia bacterium]|nr:tryptophan--tRNA ligase [Spirochaetia bacterium]